MSAATMTTASVWHLTRGGTGASASRALPIRFYTGFRCAVHMKRQHAATIRRWAAEDRKSNKPQSRNQDYSVQGKPYD